MFRTILAALALTTSSVVFAAQDAEALPPAPEPATAPATVVVTFDTESITPLIVEGVRNFESNAPVKANDPVRIASISKLLMALVTLKLVDEGKVDLDKDVSEYLGWSLRSPNWPDAKVTLAQLLSHRAGLRDEAGYVIPLGESLQERLANRKSWYAFDPPGKARFEYSNLGSAVVATTLEAATGERYDRLLQRTVFGPMDVQACINWIGCSDDMVANAVALYRHSNEPARDYPGDLPPECSIPVAQGVECSLENYVPGTNASVFSPQGGVRIGMMDLAKIGQQLMLAKENKQFSKEVIERMQIELLRGQNRRQDFFCTYGLHLHMINVKMRECLDQLFEDSDQNYFGHSGEAYGLQSGLWFDAKGERGFVYFRTQVPPPAGGEDTGGFVQGEKDLMKRAQAILATKANK